MAARPVVFKLKPRDSEGATACFVYTLSGPDCADGFIRAINQALGSPNWALYTRVEGDFVRLPVEQLSKAAETAAANAGEGFADQLLAEAEGSATILWWEVRALQNLNRRRRRPPCLLACCSRLPWLDIAHCGPGHAVTLLWSMSALPWPTLMQPTTPAANGEHRPNEGGSTGGHCNGGSGRRLTISSNSSDASGKGKKRPTLSTSLASEAHTLAAQYCAQKDGE